MDVMELDAATNRGIEEIRDLRDRVRYAPVESRYKVYIIDEVHMLTTEAFNALLKTLEEPPGHVIFILATTEAHKIPATVLSRCQRFDFRPLSEVQIAEHLADVANQNGVTLSHDAASLMAFRARGGMRDALGLLEQVIAYTDGQITADLIWEALGSVDQKSLIQLLLALGQGDTARALTLIAEFSNQGADSTQLLTDMLEVLRGSLMASVGAAGSKNLFAELSSALPRERIISMMDQVVESLKDGKYWLSSRLALEMLAVRSGQRELSVQVSTPKPSVQQPSDTVPAPASEWVPIDPAKWDELLTMVKKDSISSYAWVKEAKAELTSEGIELVYPAGYMLHRDSILKGEHRQVLVPALKKVLGIDQYTARVAD
jgi:DNA polymerase-3 subunit gamma/tau